MILGLAPMDGITDCAYRMIVQDIFEENNKKGEELWLWTEFMNVDGYLINPHKLIRHMVTTSSQNNLIAQIYGWKEESLIKAAIDIEKKYWNYFAGIELNIGCPSPRVMAWGWGSGMMKDKANTLSIIKNIKQNISLPFSIKTRSWLNSEDEKSQFDFILEASQYCHIIWIHGRFFKQSHAGDVNWDFIYDVKKHISQERWDDCKIIWNGGIRSYEDIQLRCQNLDGIMVWQAAIGNPWVFVDHSPTLEERHNIILKHINLSLACELYFSDYQEKNRKKWQSEKYSFPMPTKETLQAYQDSFPERDLSESRAPIEFRKFLFNYVKGIPSSKEFKIKVATIKDYYELVEEIDAFFEQSKNSG